MHQMELIAEPDRQTRGESQLATEAGVEDLPVLLGVQPLPVDPALILESCGIDGPLEPGLVRPAERE